MTRERKSAAIVILITLACAFMAAAVAVIDVWQANAVGESYTITFLTGEGEDDLVDFSSSWRGDPVYESGAMKMTRAVGDGTINYRAGVNKYNVVEGTTYIVELKIKTDGEVRMQFGTEMPRYNWFFTATKINNPEYVGYIYEYSAPLSDRGYFIFQLLSGEGNVFVKDFRFYEKVTKTVTEGAAIGALPPIPAKEGFTGCWTIDNKVITAETVYDFGADKTAVAEYRNDSEIKSVSISLNGDVALNFYVKTAVGAKVFFTFEGNKTEATEYTDGGEYRVCSYAVAAKDYDKKVTISIGENEDVSQSISVKDYVDAAKNKFDGALKNLVDALDVYCSSAKNYFGGVAVGEVVAADDDISSYPIEKSGTLPSGITLNGISLLLDSKVTIRLYMSGNVGGTAFKTDGETATVMPVTDGSYYIEKTNIAAKDLDKGYVFSAGSDFRLTISVFGYVNKAMGTDGDNFDNLLRALYNYGVAANAYFPEDDNLNEITDMADTVILANGLENGVRGYYNADKSNYTVENGKMSLTHGLVTAGARCVTAFTNKNGGNYLTNSDVFVLSAENKETYAKNSTDIIESVWPTVNGVMNTKTPAACAPYVNVTKLGYYYYQVNVRNLNFGNNLYLDKTYHVYSDRAYQVYRLLNQNDEAVSTVKSITFQAVFPVSSVNKFEIKNGNDVIDSIGSATHYNCGTSAFEYAAFDVKGAGIMAFINTAKNSTFYLIKSGDYYYFRQIVSVGELSPKAEVTFGNRLYNDETHDFEGVRAANAIEQNPLTADNVSVVGDIVSGDGQGFVGYDGLRGCYVINIAGSGFTAAYNNPDRKYIDNVTVTSPDDREVFFSVHSTNPLEGAAITDKNGLLLPMGLEVMKNFGHEHEEPIYDYDDNLYGDTLFPVSLKSRKTLDFSVVNVYQNWGKYPLKQISSISYYISYYHMSTGVTETNCLAPYYATYLNKDDLGAWILPDFRGMSNDGQSGSDDLIQNCSVGALNGVSNGASLSSAEADLGVYQSSEIHSAGLTYADMSYSYVSKKGDYKFTYRHVEMPQTDESRTYYTVEIEFLKSTTLKYSDFSIFSFDPRRPTDSYKKAAYLDASGNHREISVSTPSGGTLYKLNKNGSYFTYYNGTTNGEGGNFGLIVKNHFITVNGKASDLGLAFYNGRIKRGGKYVNRGSLTLAANTTFAIGDKITVNAILLPYGSVGQTSCDNVKKVYQDSVTNALSVTAQTGTVVFDEYIATIKASRYGTAEFTLGGGATAESVNGVNYAIKVTGIKKLGKLKVEKKNSAGEWESVELASVSGFDGYSAEYENGTMSYSFVVNKTAADITYRVTVI